MSSTKTGSYKYCVVKNCKSTTLKCPDKLFFSVPSDPKRRNAWFVASRVNPSNYSANTHLDVCQDHFNLGDDAENYVEVMICPDRKIRLKSNVVPHIFECQPDRAAAQPEKERPLSAKRARKSLVEGLVSSTKPSMSSDPVHQEDVDQDQPGTSGSNTETSERNVPKCFDIGVQVGVLGIDKSSLAKALTTTRSCQTRVSANSRGVQAQPHIRSKEIQCDLGLGKTTTSIAVSPINVALLHSKPLQSLLYSDDSSPIQLSGKSSSWSPSTKESHSESEEIFLETKSRRNMNIKLCFQNSMLYLGIPKSHMSVINYLAKRIPTEELKILFCLKKIRLDRTFQELGSDFDVSESFASKTFGKTVPLLAHCAASLIQWPDGNLIKERLPISFRARYSHVQSIIDCFEIDIQKPSNPVLQTLTWSNYKQANTMKYLISSTPDGFINFVSKGFGGRTSDIKITELSGYLDVLPEGVGVITDRGFKGIAKLLENKKCVLIRPPSVQSGQKRSKDEVQESKRIASLRIHIERVIRRLREFSMLEPHACVNHNHIKYLDCIVMIACRLINMQKPLMKKHV